MTHPHGSHDPAAAAAANTNNHNHNQDHNGSSSSSSAYAAAAMSYASQQHSNSNSGSRPSPYPPAPAPDHQHQHHQHHQQQQSQPPQQAQHNASSLLQQSPFKQSFNDASFSPGGMGMGMGMRGQQAYEKPQIYTAVYSGVQVYEMEVNGVACMRRRVDGWLNATQILKVAGVEKGKRTKVLEKEILTGTHEKVQGGYGKYQGTWISYQRGREFCRQYGVEEALRPLLEYDLPGDTASAGQQVETPTKEQAMAANRKRMYNSSLDQRNGGGGGGQGGQGSQSTFFQNISPMSSIALEAMRKAARLNSPVRPPTHAQRRTSMQNQQQQQQQQQQQNQPSSLLSEGSFPEPPGPDSGYNTQNGTAWRGQGSEQQPPPRKRMRTEDSQADVSMMSIDGTTEPNDYSIIYSAQQYLDSQADPDEPATLPPLPSPSTPEQEEKKALLLDLFADANRQDYASHPALTQLSPEDLGIPLDTSANTALHWAATLSRVVLLRMLIQKGANIWRGNVAGQSALISAVLVNNCWEHSSFPDVLELLNPLIELRDAQGRTILHHIAVSSGIKGRAPSSKYYLEALLEWLVRTGLSGRKSPASSISISISTSSSNNNNQEPRRPTMNLMRFMTHVVNARDKLGNTALNLVARIGNRSIIQQLLEIKADPAIANYKGVSARDFGVGVDDDGDGAVRPLLNGLTSTPTTFADSNANLDPAFGALSRARPRPDGDAARASATADGEEVQTPPPVGGVSEDANQDVISSLTTMLTQNYAQHKLLMSQRAARIDDLNAQISDLATTHKRESDQVASLIARAKSRQDRASKIANLRRVIDERRRAGKRSAAMSNSSTMEVGHADQLVHSVGPLLKGFESANIRPASASPDPASSGPDMSSLSPATIASLEDLPPVSHIRALVAAYKENNDNLRNVSEDLRSRSVKLEQLYRKVVSLSTGVPEDRVEEALPGLVAAVESEGLDADGGVGGGAAGGRSAADGKGAGAYRDAGRVREFLVKVEGVNGGGAFVGNTPGRGHALHQGGVHTPGTSAAGAGAGARGGAGSSERAHALAMEV